MKAFSIIKIVFSLLGFGMLAVSLFLYTATKEFLKDAVTAQGTVTELVRSKSSDSTTYRPVVEFKTADGSVVEFTSSMGSNPPSFSRGEVVEVFYEEASPEKAKINTFFSLWGLPLIFGSVGLVFFLIGFSMVIFAYFKKKKIAYLKQRGDPVYAKFQRVERNTSTKVNGVSPFRIVTQWMNPVTSELHIFKSDNIWFDPTDHIKTDELRVLIERNNPKKYHLDLSFLPRVAE